MDEDVKNRGQHDHTSILETMTLISQKQSNFAIGQFIAKRPKGLVRNDHDLGTEGDVSYEYEPL